MAALFLKRLFFLLKVFNHIVNLKSYFVNQAVSFSLFSLSIS